eukprot:TRINITY_DN56880_c0_g1_i2.p1 TRINITY_DN56880_c0_g1~~TRINITY_DN56880_c0_g1_i2.p1  ORF type:complete len:305 (-),score=91.77 TRINITY_DN56880_c0_g1_i2:130-1044(-)
MSFFCVFLYLRFFFLSFFFFQAEDGIRDAQESRGLGDVYKRQYQRRVRVQANVERVDAESTTKFGEPIPFTPKPLGDDYNNRMEKLERLCSRLELRSTDFKKAFERYENDVKVKDAGNLAWRAAEQKALDKRADDLSRREDALRTRIDEADQKFEKSLKTLALAEEKEKSKIQYRVETREERKVRIIAEARKKPANARGEYQKQLSEISKEEDEEALQARSEEHERRMEDDRVHEEKRDFQQRQEDEARRLSRLREPFNTPSAVIEEPSMIYNLFDGFVHLVANTAGKGLNPDEVGKWLSLIHI